MMALPHAYRNATAPNGSVISVKVTATSVEEWKIIFPNHRWSFTSIENGDPDTSIEMSADTGWKLCTKALPEAVAIERVKI